MLVLRAGPNFIVLPSGKQISVLTVAEKFATGASVLHRLAEELGGHIAHLPYYFVLQCWPVTEKVADKPCQVFKFICT